MSDIIERSRPALAEFCRRRRVAELALFGSVLRGSLGPESDVDVLVTFEPGVRYSTFDLADMRAELAEIFGREVDLVEKPALRNPFRRQAILAGSRVVYAG
jgi:hypothetical protein